MDHRRELQYGRVVRRPSPALVVSIIALVFAMGGTGWAVTQLPKNSVGTQQLKNSAVTSPKIKDGAIAIVDLSTAARTSLKGQKGDPGATGARGPSSAVRYPDTDPVRVSALTEQRVAAFRLDPGAWIVFATATVRNLDPTTGARASCTLIVGDEGRGAEVILTGTAATPQASMGTIAITHGGTLTGATEAVLLCSAATAAAYDIVDLSITAIKVDSLAMATALP